MVKSFVVSAIVLVSGLIVPTSALAQTTTLEPGVCTSVYGGGVICGAKHEVVETGLGENLALVGALALGASGVLLFINRKNLFRLSKNA